MTLNRSLPLLALASILLSGCPSERAAPEAPPDMCYGVDPCDRCAMIVSEERWAAAWVGPAGEVRRFDDLGCLTALLAERPEQVSRVWVHDHETGRWLRSDQATFVRVPELMTPMGTGLVAVASEDRARGLARERKGQLLDERAFLALGAGAFGGER